MRLALLADGYFNRRNAKTAIGLLRYRRPDCVAVIDRQNAGRDAFDCVGEGRGVPVVESLTAARGLGADTVAIGIAIVGDVPEPWFGLFEEALRHGLTVVNGLHEPLATNARLASAAAAGRGRIWDVRRPPTDLPLAGHRERRGGARVVLTVGSDASIGKMTVALEVAAALSRRGRSTEFVPTGQTGIMIAGWGISLDAVVGDYVAGAAEVMTCQAAGRAEWVIVEGQGALTHPAFSGVTLGLLHGSSPDYMLLVHDPSRKAVLGYESEAYPLRSLRELIKIHEEAASWPPNGRGEPRVVGVALNTFDLDSDEATRAIDVARQATGLVVTDVIRFGAEPLVDRLLQG